METPTSPGWYDDPEDAEQLRYFDGIVWTAHKQPRTTRRAQPVAEPTGQEQRGQGQTGQASHQASTQANPQFPGTPTSSAWNSPAHPQQQWGQQPGQGAPPGWQQPGQGQQWGQQWSGPATPDGRPLASYGQRAGAFIIDWILQLLLGLVFGGYFLWQAMADYMRGALDMANQVEAGTQPDIQGLIERVDAGALMVYSIIGIGVFFLYQWYFLKRSGQTPGKAVCNISVRELARPGVPSSAAVLRRVGFAVALFVLQALPLLGLFGFVGRILDLLWPAWDQQRQALHDKAAGTVVVVGKQRRD
jgi:uncharacterized RDD family membrane protein YckC